MTQNEKDLLLKDLCARLPYNIKVYDNNGNFNTSYVNLLHINGKVSEAFVGNGMQCRTAPIEEVKPYLFPLSSMTEEQKNSFPFSYSFLEALIDDGVYFDEDECITLNDMIEVIQWCYKNHFDIHGLIPKGLANDATGLNIY